MNVGGAGANVGGAGANVGCAGGTAGASAEGVPLNFPIPGKRSPTVSGLCTGMLTEGVCDGGGGGGGVATVGADGTTQSLGFGGAAVSQSGAGVAAGAGTRPSATSRGSTSSVMRSPSSPASVG